MTLELFGMEVEASTLKRKKTNPLIRVFGEGPEGAKCGECTFHYFRVFAKNYPKCEKRDVSSSPKTDHSSRFAACGRFVVKPTGKIWIRRECSVCESLSDAREFDRDEIDEQLLARGWRKDEASGLRNGLPVWIAPEVACGWKCTDELKKLKKSR